MLQAFGALAGVFAVFFAVRSLSRTDESPDDVGDFAEHAFGTCRTSLEESLGGDTIFGDLWRESRTYSRRARREAIVDGRVSLVADDKRREQEYLCTLEWNGRRWSTTSVGSPNVE